MPSLENWDGGLKMYMYIHVMVRTELKRVNEEILLGRKPTSMHNCKFISSCTIMYVCMYIVTTCIIMYCGANSHTHQN